MTQIKILYAFGRLRALLCPHLQGEKSSLGTISSEIYIGFALYPQVQSSSYSPFPSNQFTICSSLHLPPKTRKEAVVAVWLLEAK